SFTAGGLYEYAFPEHHYEGVPISEIPEATQSLEDAIGFGPYVLEEILPGEHVIFSTNADYWRREPALDGVEITSISASPITHAVATAPADPPTRLPPPHHPPVPH